MATFQLSASLWADMLRGAVANLKQHARAINDLNVFPIPDGDTGDNMTMTVQGGLRALREHETDTLGGLTRRIADGMLLGARGNSGVILSQFFEGIARVARGAVAADTPAFTRILQGGVQQAYSAVLTPTEGTILTVMREGAEAVEKTLHAGSSFEELFDVLCREARASLRRTPDLLPVLREAGVIDSGGEGFCCLMEGMRSALLGEEIEDEGIVGQAAAVDLSCFDENTELVYGYCTEGLLQLQTSKVNVEEFPASRIISYLETIGNSIVAFKTGTRIRFHVHTTDPGAVLTYCRQFGEFLTIKIENMTLQHNETAEISTPQRQPIQPHKAFATVAVASGEGLRHTFLELGADAIVEGSQTMNPSTEDFLAAFRTVNADRILVLPNNKNILLAARQAADLFDSAEVYILESTTVAQGYAALTMLDYSSGDIEEILRTLRETIAAVSTGMVTRACRNSSLDGKTIREGDWIGLCDGHLLAVGSDKVGTACSLLSAVNRSDKAVVIALCGNDVSRDEADAVRRHVESLPEQLEWYAVDDGQDIYSFTFAIE